MKDGEPCTSRGVSTVLEGVTPRPRTKGSMAWRFLPYELLKNASDLTNADTGFMVSWAVKGIVGLLIGYVFMYFGGMLGHTAAYRTLYGIRVRLSEHISELPLGWFNRNAIGKVKQIAEQDVEQIEKFIAHQFPCIW